MNTGFPSLVRVGLLALGLSAGATGLSYAGPAGLAITDRQLAPAADAGVIEVQEGLEEWRRNGKRYHGGGGAWQEHGGDWNDTRVDEYPRHEKHRRDWRRFHDDDGYRRYHRRPTVYFDLELTPQRYIQPRYHAEPRRSYRRLARAHVAWCYDRYISYRASDNTFKPNHGPRRQCYSPFS